MRKGKEWIEKNAKRKKQSQLKQDKPKKLQFKATNLWKRALEEAESFEMPWKLRDFFALILVHCNPAKPEELWEMFKESLSEDFSRSFRQEIAYAKAYREIALSIRKAGKTLADFPSMEQINVDEDIEQAFNAAEELVFFKKTKSAFCKTNSSKTGSIF